MQDGVFRALADPTRRAILDLLFEQEGRSLGELERHFAITRFGVMKHVRVLEETGLVVTRKVGRARLHYLNPVPIQEIQDRWTGKFAARASAALLALRDGLEKGARMAVSEVPAHVYVVFIQTTPERIWDALTQSAFTEQYYFASTVESEWTDGADYEYLIQGQQAITGKVLEAVPPSRLSMTFDAQWDEHVAPDPPSRITWEIEAVGDELCKLTVVHDGFESETATYGQVAGGMPLILSGLKTLLETGTPLPMPVMA
jgi:uncharacterized protein YndB with AHSA1/START domain/DNA-binding transcriptional ArsR family regulator